MDCIPELFGILISIKATAVKSFMHNLRNSFLILLSLSQGCTGLAAAATLISFDKPNLVVVYDSKGTYGYYSDVTIKPSAFGDDEGYECTFMFMRVDRTDELTLRSLNRPIKDWNSAPYTEGLIRVDGSVWQIRFSNRPKGCSGLYAQQEIFVPHTGPGANATEYGARGAYFKVVQKTEVVGIRWVRSSAVIQRRIIDKFVATGKELAVGTVAVELKKSGKFSEVEYFDLYKSRKVRVWVLSTKLTSPYPKS